MMYNLPQNISTTFLNACWLQRFLCSLSASSFWSNSSVWIRWTHGYSRGWRRFSSSLYAPGNQKFWGLLPGVFFGRCFGLQLFEQLFPTLFRWFWTCWISFPTYGMMHSLYFTSKAGGSAGKWMFIPPVCQPLTHPFIFLTVITYIYVQISVHRSN